MTPEFSLLQQLQESVNDKGLFKAVFVTGIPGAGKSYTTQQLTDGAIQPKVVNSDKMFEFLGKQGKIDVADDMSWHDVSDTVEHTTKAMLTNYVNGMLPLFVDSTNASPAAILRRKGILESLGYDCSLVWINVDLQVAVARAEKRERHVPEPFIRAAWEQAVMSKKYIVGKFDHVQQINNNDGAFDDAAVRAAYNATSSFFRGNLVNPIGIETLQKLKQTNEKYLAPTIASVQEINHLVSAWYKRS